MLPWWPWGPTNANPMSVSAYIRQLAAMTTKLGTLWCTFSDTAVIQLEALGAGICFYWKYRWWKAHGYTRSSEEINLCFCLFILMEGRKVGTKCTCDPGKFYPCRLLFATGSDVATRWTEGERNRAQAKPPRYVECRSSASCTRRWQRGAFFTHCEILI